MVQDKMIDLRMVTFLIVNAIKIYNIQIMYSTCNDRIERYVRELCSHLSEIA